MKTMQKITLLFCLVLTGVVAGCDYIAKHKPEALSKEQDVTPEEAALVEAVAWAGEQERIFNETIGEIDENLQEITRREGIIFASGDGLIENIPAEKERILQNIEAINNLVIDNRKKIESLDEQLRRTKYDGTKLNDMLVEAEEKVREYEEQVGDLKRQLVESDYRYAAVIKQIDAVVLANESLVQSLNWYDEEFNAVYYTEGSTKELKRQGIIDKKGDLLGIGGTKVLNSDLEPTNFTRIDMRETKVIPVNAKKAKLITGHEAGSYEFVKEGNQIASLNITDPNEFWKSSKYLVLETK
ncbi:MAG: hypothetical protein AB7G44_17215 [Bacteroidia bacterium]